MEKALPRPGTILPADAPGAIDAAVRVLRAGGLVGLPTETVYGLAADAGSGEAVARIYAAKGRPATNPLIAHVADAAAGERLIRMNDTARRLAAAFWPGPLTLVGPVREGAPLAAGARAGRDTLAVRAPAHPTARAVLNAFGGPVVAPSANRSGRVSPTTAAHVAADLGADVALILDAGPCAAGLESTIVLCRGDRAPEILRPGAIAFEDLSAVAPGVRHPGPRAGDDESDAPGLLAPGMMTSHYAPRAGLRLNAADQGAGEAYLAFGPPPAGVAEPWANLSAKGDLEEAARHLFAHLRMLDEAGARVIAVAPVPDVGLGRAINDRLARAAAPRG